MPEKRLHEWIEAVETESKSLAKSKRAVLSHWSGGEQYTPFTAEKAAGDNDTEAKKAAKSRKGAKPAPDPGSTPHSKGTEASEERGY